MPPAATAGARVIVCDEQAEFGGALLHATSSTIDGRNASDWIAQTVTELRAHERVTLLPRTTAFGYFADNFVGLVERVTDHLAAPAYNILDPAELDQLIEDLEPLAAVLVAAGSQ